MSITKAREMEYYLYTLECADGMYYVGITNDLDNRVREHQEGINGGCFTYYRRPVVLKKYLTYLHINDAIYFEKKVKKWSRAKKEAFFNKDLNTLHKAAACKNKTSHKNRSSGAET